MLELIPVDQMLVRGMHNKAKLCDVFNVDLRFESASKLNLWLPDVMVAEVEFASLEEGIRVVLGRSIMWRGRFVYDARKPSKMEFTFER